ncbi:MAG: tetratricopeptide repeat protein [Gemmatimonadetes bacterium]|nr:tetratricopeptide repeat protein [Gemmatimonadota bacterium]
MGRRRRKKRALEVEPLQGELLSEAMSPREFASDADSTESATEPEPTSAERSEPSQDAVPEPAVRPEPAASASASSRPSAPAEEASGRDSHESARDHAAAGARPAGEPLTRARSLVERGRIHEAIQLYLGILTVNPSNLKARNNLGVLFDGLKQFDAARDHLEAAVRIEPDNVEVLTNLASTLTSLARYEDAEGMLRRAQRVDPDDLRVHLSIGILYFRRGMYAQAETELRWVCARDRDNGLAFYYRGESLNRLGRYDEATQAMERAAELLPDDPKPAYTLGRLYDCKHMPEEAAEMYRRARRLQSP